MKTFETLSESEARLVIGGTINAGIEFFGICAALFIAGWECGRGLAQEVKTWFK
jgi:hypothetical protein